jgi:hypothetical protein
LIDPSKVATRPNVGNPVQSNTSSSTGSAEVIPHRPTTRRFNGREGFSTPSIMDALRDEPKKVEKGTLIEGSVGSNVGHVDENPFSLKELVVAWKNFVDSIEAAQLKSALSAREPVLAENWQVQYELDSELQLNRLTLDLKPKLLGFLRETFKNESIEILFKVSANTIQQTRTPYTDAERWDSLVEKYPALATLKSKFGLDFEHS